MKRCNKCGVGLEIGKNWTKGSERNYIYRCSKCQCAVRKANRLANGDRDRVRSAQYHLDNKEKINARSSLWAKENADRANAKCAKRRAMKMAQTPDMSKAEWAEIDAMYMYNKIMPGDWEVDHIVALSNGGLHHPDNLQVLSMHDNRSKGAKL